MRQLLLLLALVGCAEVALDAAPADPGLTEVRWILAWDLDGTESTPTGWCTTTDLGHTVCVEGGVLTSAMTSLVACSDQAARDWRPSLLDLFVSTAVAGHPGDLDPSSWGDGQVEDLASPVAREVGSRTLYGETYCQAHWVTDAAWSEATGSSDRMVGTSLAIWGTVYTADGQERPLDLHTDLAWGSLQDLPELPDRDGAVGIQVVRSLAPLFDGIDFSAAEATPEVDVLRNLSDSLRFELLDD